MKHKKYIVILLLFTTLLTLVGCKGKITSGEVVDKNFTPAHTKMLIIPIVYTNGKTTQTILQPYFYYYPDVWEVTIVGYDKDGKQKSATYRVTKNVYDDISIGAEFVYDKNMKPSEPEYTRERAN